MTLTKFLLVVAAIFLAAGIVLFFLWRLSASKRKEQEKTISRLSGRLETALKINNNLEQTIDVLKGNRDKADEKIDSLHNGDSIGNAIDELSNSKN